MNFRISTLIILQSWKRKVNRTSVYFSIDTICMHAQRDEGLWFHKRGDALKAFDTMIEMQSTQIIRMLGLMHVRLFVHPHWLCISFAPMAVCLHS